MEDNYKIGILGANGTLGKELMQILKTKKINAVGASRSKGKDELISFDINDVFELNRFIKDKSIIVGTAAPSYLLSTKMYNGAKKYNIPYIDPGGGCLIKNKNDRNFALIETGILPGLSGLLLNYHLSCEEGFPLSIEMYEGGDYNLSKGSKQEMEHENLVNGVKNLYKCIKNGVEIFEFNENEKDKLLNLIVHENKYSAYLYLTDEIREICQKQSIKNLKNYLIRRTEKSTNDYCVNRVFIIIKVIYEEYYYAYIYKTYEPDYVAAYMIYYAILVIAEEKKLVGINRFSNFINPKIFMDKIFQKLPITTKTIKHYLGEDNI